MILQIGIVFNVGKMVKEGESLKVQNAIFNEHLSLLGRFLS